MTFSKKLQVYGSSINAEALVQGAVIAQANVISFENQNLTELPKK